MILVNIYKCPALPPSPPFPRSRYENHSPSTTAGNGNAASNLDRIVKSERNNGSANEANDDERELMDESTDVSRGHHSKHQPPSPY